jgi:cobalt/nickel transport system permease protein
VDGALSNEVVIGGAVLAAGGVALGLRALPMEKIPAAGLLSAGFFVASLLYVPVVVSSVHLVFNGLAGLVLGWAAFPALLIALLLQAVFFGFGGLTVLGVNTVVIALPAVLIGLALRRRLNDAPPRQAALWAALAGGGSIALTAVFVAIALRLSGESFVLAAKLALVTHIPVMAVEAVITGLAAYLIAQVKPELFTALGESR